MASYRKLAVLAAVALVVSPLSALATDRSYTGLNSWWDLNANWSPAGIPQAGDIVRITAGTADNFCHYRSANGGWVYGTFYVQSTNGGTPWLWNEAADPATALNAGALYLAYEGNGGILQRTGAWSFSGVSYIGRSAGASGTYQLDGGSVSFGSSLSMGSYGTGVFKQAAGTTSIAGQLTLAYYASGTGRYDLLGGTLNSGDTAVEDVIVGRGGVGIFNHKGGTHTLSGDLMLGYEAGSNGEYSQEYAGSGSAPRLSAVNATVGSSGQGLWRMAYGTATLSGSLAIGSAAGGAGAMVVNDSTLTAASATVGSSGSGALSVIGSSTVTLNGGLTLGAYAGGSGTLDVLGGTMYVHGNIADGAGVSTINIDGGSLIPDGSVSADELNIGKAAAGSWSVSGNTMSLGTVYVGRGHTGSFTQNANSVNVSNSARIGYGGSGTWTVQGNANLSVGASLIVGDGAAGELDLQHGYVQVQNDLVIGSNANGVYSMADQTSVHGNVYLGEFPGGHGELRLRADYLYAGDADTDSVYIGSGGTAKLDHSGGTLQASGRIYIGDRAGSAAEYSLVDDLAVTGSPRLYCDALTIGNLGSAVFTNTGGQARIYGDVSVGAGTGGQGLMRLSGAGTTTVDGAMNIGPLGTGTVHVATGATLTVAGPLQLGGAGTGTFTLAGGTVTTSDITGGAGSCLQLNSGTLNVVSKSLLSETVQIGAGTTGTPVFTLPATHTLTATSALRIASDANATLAQYGTVTALNAYVGDGKTGTWNIQSGATAAVTGGAYAGYDTGGTIRVAGTLNSATLYSGFEGTGALVYIAIGGAASHTGTLSVGDQIGSSGELYLQGGTLQSGDAATDLAYVGRYGTGVVNNPGGAHSVAGSLYIGRYASGNGAYHLDDDPVVLNVYPSLTARALYVGYSGTGAFTESGANSTASVQQSVFVGYNAGSAGTVAVNGGTFSVAYDMTLGHWGTGSMAVSGGQVNIGRDVWIAGMSGGTGSLDLIGGRTQITGRVIGYGGSTLKFDGGDLSVGSGQITVENIIVSSAGGRTGHFNLTSETVNANILQIGAYHAGTMDQSGGSLAVAADMLIGSADSLTGAYSLTGSGSAQIGGNVRLGSGNGTGQITQSGGTLTAGGDMTLGVNGRGNVDLSAGTMSVAGGLSIGEGLGRHGTFTQTGGAVTVGGNLRLGGLGGDGRFVSAGGVVTASGSMILGEGGVFELAGGILGLPSASALSVSSTGLFAFHSGELRLAGPSILDDAFLTSALGSGRMLSSGQKLSVAGGAELRARLELDGGEFAFASLTNPASLEVRRGTVHLSSGLTLATSQTFGAALNIRQDQTWHSDGSVQIASGAAVTMTGGRLRGDAGVSNSGLISGFGTVTGALVNSGEVSVAATDRLVFDTPTVAMNTGTLRLLGGEMRFADKLSNQAAGFITGRGTLTAATISNMGVLSFSGGYTDIFGDVTNLSSGKIISTGGGTVTFYDDVVNNSLGEIRTSAGCATVFLGGLSGSGRFTGLGTVYSEGDLRPGQSPGLMRIDGNLSLSSTSALYMEVGGTTAGSSYDQIVVGGTASAAGTLDVQFVNGYLPRYGDHYTLISAGTMTGGFEQVNLPVLSSGMYWQVAADGGVFAISVVPEPVSLLAAGWA